MNRLRRVPSLCLLVMLGLALSVSAGFLDDIGDARQMLGEANQQGDELLQYGNWYGPGWWGGDRDPNAAGAKPPVDELDAIAMRHDFGYQLADEWGAIYGEREAQRIRAMADAVAVQEAAKLDPDPSKWNPPATDPERADRYRDRIGFGFGYTASGRSGYSTVLNTGSWVTSPVQNWYSGYSENQMTPETMKKLIAARVQKWHRDHPPLPTFQLEMQKSQDVIAEGGSATFQITARPLIAEEPWKDSYAVRIHLFVDGGPGKLDKLSCNLGETVTVTATSRTFGLSAEGYRVSISARSDNAESGITILPVTGQFTVGKSSALSLSASPSSVELLMEADGACQNVTAEATLVDGQGNPIPDQPVRFEVGDGVVATEVTDANGVCAASISVCPSDAFGDPAQVSIRAVYAGREQGDPIIGGSATAASIAVTSIAQQSFSGRVTNARNGNAISGVTLSVEGPEDSDSATSSSQGAFTFSIQVPSDMMEQMATSVTITATKEGYESVTITKTAFELDYDIEMPPKEITLTGTVYDKESGEALSGAFGEISDPFGHSFGTGADGGFSIEGLYVGDRVTITCWAVNHQAYRKSGVITSTTPHLSFYLPVGEGEIDSGLNEEDRPEEDEDAEESSTVGLTIWASPADPVAGQGVTVTALVHPIQAGIPIRLAIVGTDGYANSVTTVTDATGKAYLYIPGASSGVVDRVTVTLLDQATSRRLNYTF